MKNTPLSDGFNQDLLDFIPSESSRVVEVGCGTGSLAEAYLRANSRCEYIGIEHDAEYARAAREKCTQVIHGSIEQLADEVFLKLFPSDCWVFGDVLEHLFDPWAVLRRIRSQLSEYACVVACIPNAQHWSVQGRLNSGLFRYEDTGLLDRTHIRWFTRTTMVELFDSCGYRIVEARPRVFETPDSKPVLEGVRRMAECIGADPELAVEDSVPYQWVIKAIPS